MSQMITVVLKPVTETGTTEAFHLFFFLLCLYFALHFLNVFFFLLPINILYSSCWLVSQFSI